MGTFTSDSTNPAVIQEEFSLNLPDINQFQESHSSSTNKNLSSVPIINQDNHFNSSSSATSSSSSTVDEQGAKGEAKATTISPDGEVEESSESVVSPDGTAVEATATAINGTDTPPTTETTVVTLSEADHLTTISIRKKNKGNKGNDSVDRGTEQDIVRRGQGNDILIGGDGDDVLIGNLGQQQLTGGAGADVFVLKTNPSFRNSNPNLADIITDFNPAEGDQIGIVENLIAQSLILETLDWDGDGRLDATIIKLDSDHQSQALGVVLGTVSATGETTLTIADFSEVSNDRIRLG